MLIILKKQINKTQTPALPPFSYPKKHHKFLMLTSGLDLNFLLVSGFGVFWGGAREGVLIQNTVLPLVYCSSVLTCRLHTVYCIMKGMVWHTLLWPVVSLQAATAPCLVLLVPQSQWWCWHATCRDAQKGQPQDKLPADHNKAHTYKTHFIIHQQDCWRASELFLSLLL